MKFKKPRAIMIAETTTLLENICVMLDEIGATEYIPDGPTDTEELIEIAGRLCYRSFAPNLNPNVKKIREGNREYLGNILKQHHGSVLEHASVTFAFLNVSRVFTHEIVRHRAGTAFSQESLRYVRLTDLGAYEPDVFDDEDKAVLIGVFEHVEAVQKMLADKHGLDTENSFSKKKLLTSAFRRMAPLGLTTNIIVTANHRAWRHMIAMRASAGAEEEIRKVFLDVATKLKKRFPNLYQDMIFELDADGNETGVVWFEHEKV